MSFENLPPPTTPERDPPRVSATLEEVAESLREAQRFGDDFGWLAEVMGGTLPGEAIVKHITILKRVDFGTTNEFSREVEHHVTEAIRYSYLEYDRAIAETVHDLNVFLQSMQGVFSIHGVEDSILVSISIQTEGEKLIPQLYAQTTRGIISIERAKLDIDITKLSPEE